MPVNDLSEVSWL